MIFTPSHRACNGEMSALRDWLKEGAFSNPYQEGTAEYRGYYYQQSLIEHQNRINEFLQDRIGA